MHRTSMHRVRMWNGLGTSIAHGLMLAASHINASRSYQERAPQHRLWLDGSLPILGTQTQVPATMRRLNNICRAVITTMSVGLFANFAFKGLL